MNKTLPNNKEAEIALLSIIFQNNDIISETVSILKDTDFYYTSHKIIYSRTLELYKKDIPVDVITFSNSISKDVLQSIGGITYLTEIIASEPGITAYKTYIKIIKELSIKRELIKACTEALEKMYGEEAETKDIINNIQDKLLTVNENNFENNKTLNINELMEQTINLIDEGYRSGGSIRGVTTGYKPIDKATNGFMKGDLMIIAARPSMGKTALALNMLSKLPKENKAALFEMEMSAEKLGIRLLAPKTLINPQNLSRGEIKDNDFELIIKKAGEIALKDNIFINCKAGLTIGEIKAEAKRLKLKYGLDVIFIDHIGKVRPDNIRATRNDQIGQISEGLKNIAKDLNISVVALSQLNRAVEQRTGKKPALSDLRESGNIEQDADEILMLYRDDYYAEREGKQSNHPGILEILVAKNRDGEVGIIKLSYNTKYQIITEQPLFR